MMGRKLGGYEVEFSHGVGQMVWRKKQRVACVENGARSSIGATERKRREADDHRYPPAQVLDGRASIYVSPW